jgi:hypothetical protein
VARIHADIDALRGLYQAMARFRQAGRGVADRGDDQITVTRASLEAKATRWRSRLEQANAELGACRLRAAEAAAVGIDLVDCSAYARAASEAEERLEHIRRWQYRVDAEASEFLGIASRFRAVLEEDLPRTEDHLRAIIASLEAARRLQVPGT